jgi:hypothetical protein
MSYQIDVPVEAMRLIDELQKELHHYKERDAIVTHELATMTDLAEDWAIRCKEAQHQLREVTKELDALIPKERNAKMMTDKELEKWKHQNL